MSESKAQALRIQALLQSILGDSAKIEVRKMECSPETGHSKDCPAHPDNSKDAMQEFIDSQIKAGTVAGPFGSLTEAIDSLNEVMSSSGDAKIEALRKIFGGAPESADNKGPRAATAAELNHLLRAPQNCTFVVGDVVKLRRPGIDTHMTFPKLEDEVIVTQVLETPLRTGEVGSNEQGVKGDFAIGVMIDGQVVEFVHDSRNFVRLGNVLTDY